MARTHMGDVIVASGDPKANHPTDPERPIPESDVTSAILKVTHEKRKTVCFVTGHGEKSLDRRCKRRIQRGRRRA